jgi:hypothetical protein
MKEENENKTTIKTVEDKKANFKWSKHEAEKPKALIALKGLKYSNAKGTWSVQAGDDVSSFDEQRLAILRNNGVI